MPCLRIERNDKDTRYKAEGPTDRDGRFRFSNLHPGNYDLRCQQFVSREGAPSFQAGQEAPMTWRVKR